MKLPFLVSFHPRIKLDNNKQTESSGNLKNKIPYE